MFLQARRVQRVGNRYLALNRSLWKIKGTVKPYRRGQVVSVRITSRGRSTSVLRPVKQGGDGKGYFFVDQVPRGTGRVSVIAFHAATLRQAAFKSRVMTVTTVNPTTRSSLSVKFLQRGLQSLGYYVFLSGRFDNQTSRAVMAYRKYNNLGRRGAANSRVFYRLAAGRGAFRVRFKNHGKHVEFDLSQQVLALIRNGKPYAVFHSSSGTSSTPTIRGSFKVYRKSGGTNSLGMVHSIYFIRGYAIHGYASVPTYPASHGCLRVPVPNSRWIFNQMGYGDYVDVYR